MRARSRRRGRGDVGGQFRGGGLRHGCPGQRGHPARLADELCGPAGRCVRDTPDVRRSRPVLKVRWHKNPEGLFRRNAGAHSVSAGEQVPEPPGLVVKERHGEGKAAERQVDLQESDESADHRVPEPDSAPVFTDHPQACGQLADGPAPRQRLHGHRHHHQAEDDGGQAKGPRSGLIKIRTGGPEAKHDQHEEHHVDYDVDGQPKGPRSKARRPELEDHRLTGNYRTHIVSLPFPARDVDDQLVQTVRV